jgi:OOP family OmpA-OmpF porin
MIKQAITAIALTLSSGLASAQSYDARAGWYAGLDLGRSRLGMSGADIDGALANQGVGGSASADRSDTAFGINGGYRFNRNFAVEAAWERLGDFSYSSSTGTDTIDGKFKANALSLAGLGIYPLTPNWSVYGKAGLARTSVDLEASSQTGATAVSSQSHSGVGWLVGAGATYDLSGGIFTKLGWDHYAAVGDGSSTGQSSIDVYSVGVGKRF